jgi:polygalacturonase
MLVAMGLMAAATPVFAAPTGTKNGKIHPQIFGVMDFGATADGVTLDSTSINKAINACNSAGGGTMYVPPGIYLCGTVVLKSNVTLYLEAGATLPSSLSMVVPHRREPRHLWKCRGAKVNPSF